MFKIALTSQQVADTTKNCNGPLTADMTMVTGDQITEIVDEN